MRKGLLVVAVVLLFIIAGRTVTAKHHHVPSPPPVTRAQAIAYIEKQLNKPYLWGGTGPDAFDCSGLIWTAFRWPADLRTSQDQWAHLNHVTEGKDGDLVFFHGLLVGKEQPPGHVGIIVSPGVMIDSYGGPDGVEYDSFGTPDSKQGLQVVWGYASP